MSAAMIVLLGSLVNVAGSAVYIVHTLRGRNKPNRMTFLMWGLVPLIGVAASLAQGVTWAVVPILFAALMPLTIFFASFINPNAYWKLGRFDYACGVISVLALFLWWLTDEPNLALLFAIIADAVAGYPTVIKAWRHPDTESWQGYAAAAISGSTAFIVASPWNFAALAFPAYLIVINIILVTGILRGGARPRVI